MKKDDKLAIFGGMPVVTEKPPRWPHVDKAMEKMLLKVFWEEQHSQIDTDHTLGEFERIFADYHDAKYCMSCNSGSQALVMAVALSGVGAGDEVIVTPYTWGASIGCVLNRGGIPVFADIDPDTLTMDPASIEKCLSSATKAIIPVHMHGQIGRASCRERV